jgi:hypothetical protein
MLVSLPGTGAVSAGLLACLGVAEDACGAGVRWQAQLLRAISVLMIEMARLLLPARRKRLAPPPALLILGAAWR